MELFEGHKQWRDRPADERYYTLKDLWEATHARHVASVASRVKLPDVKWAVVNNDLAVQGSTSTATPSHWAFGQVCDLIDAPAHYMRKLPADLAAQNMNWSMRNAPRETMQMLWANGNTPGIVRAFTTMAYSRIWDDDFTMWIRQMVNDEQNGWHRPPAITDSQYPSGLYAGDRNMFAFLVNEDIRFEDGEEGGLSRGFFAWNSEVRQMSWGIKGFLYKKVCGNHIVWGAQEMFDIRGIHVGKELNAHAQRLIISMLRAYATAPSNEQKVIDAARVKTLGSGKEDILTVLSSRKFGYTKGEAEDIYDYSVKVGKDPTNLWNTVNAATALSQTRKYADERNALDRRAGKLLEVVF